MSNVRDKLMAGSIACKEFFTPEFMKSLSSKSDAKGMEHSIDDFKKELEKIQRDIEAGLSDEFSKDTLKSVDELAGQRKKENNIGQKNTYFMLGEEKRVAEILDAFKHLEAFMHEKKLRNGEVVKSVQELKDLVYSIFKLGDTQEKLAWNEAHDHEAFARFLHLRSIHSVANHLKVLEKTVKADKNHEQKDANVIITDLKDLEHVKNMKDFEKICANLRGHVHRFVNDGLVEFKKLEEANEMIIILTNNTKHSFEKIHGLISDAQSKGYDNEAALKLIEKAKAEYEQFHTFSRLMLNWFKSVEHKSEDLRHAADDVVSHTG